MQYENFIREAYQNILGREVDQAGLEYWNQQMESGAIPDVGAFKQTLAQSAVDYSGGEVAGVDIEASRQKGQEYLDTIAPSLSTQPTQPTAATATPTATATATPTTGLYDDTSVNELLDYYYATEFGRTPDEEGREYWTNLIQSGQLTEDQIQSTLQDAGRQLGYAPQSDVNMIKEIFSAGYGKEATKEEIDYWTNEINSGNINPSELVGAIKSSDTTNTFNEYDVREQFNADYMERATGYSQDMKPFAYDAEKAMMPGYDPKAQFTFSEDDPSYQFRQEEAQKAIERSQAAKGNLLSGGAVKESARYASDLASQEYGNAFNRWQSEQLNKFNMGQSALSADYNRQLTDYNTQQNQLLNLANLGTGAMAQTQGATGAYSQNVANALTQQGQAQAAGYLGAGQAQADMYGNIAGAAQTGIGNYLTYQGQQ